jgi:uncharacterized membrane protein (UPF0127 family)
VKLFSIILFVALSGGLTLQAAPSPTPKPQLDLPSTLLSLGTNTLSVQIAADDASRELGLMSRTNLGDKEGMVFVFPQPRPVTFWMKDTPKALSIAYIDASGRILETHDMKPFDETPVPSASQSVVYALEVAKGWFLRHGVLPGDSISGLPSSTTAK